LCLGAVGKCLFEEVGEVKLQRFIHGMWLAVDPDCPISFAPCEVEIPDFGWSSGIGHLCVNGSLEWHYQCVRWWLGWLHPSPWVWEWVVLVAFGGHKMKAPIVRT